MTSMTLSYSIAMKPRTIKPESWETLAGQIRRFIGVGAANMVLTFVLYEILNVFIPYWIAYTLSFVFGIVFVMIFQARIVFVRELTAITAICLVAVYLVSYAAGLGLTVFFVDDMHIRSELVPFIVIPIMVPISFLATRYAFGRNQI
jgi:putative flippase GtrA